MQPLTSEWIAKAEGDFDSLQRELRVRVRPNYDSACFHAQQCAEKYLKGYLQEQNIPFGRTHNLLELLEYALAVQPMWLSLRSDLQLLNLYAVAYRYPGETANREQAREAARCCKIVRTTIRTALNM